MRAFHFTFETREQRPLDVDVNIAHDASDAFSLTTFIKGIRLCDTPGV